MSDHIVSIKIEVAERQLDRIQLFFPRVDSKVSVLFGTISAELGVAALNINISDFKLWYIAIPEIAFAIIAFIVIYNLYKCAYPHLDGGSQSKIYFAEIAKQTESNYIKSYMGTSESELIEDICGQIWRNSEILQKKYNYLKYATIGTMIAVLPWVVFLGAASVTHAKFPLFH